MKLLDRIFALRKTSDQKAITVDRVPYNGLPLAGVRVTPDTAITVPAVWACLRYISQTIAMLPWNAMEKTDGGGIVAENTRVHTLLHDRPNPEWSAFQFRETLTHWALRWGNGYAEIERDQMNRPYALWPIHPERVTVERDPLTRALRYKVTSGVDGTSHINAEDMFHIRGFGEGPVGVNVMNYAAESIGWAKASQLFGAAFFGNGMNIGGFIIPQKGAMTPEGKREAERDLNSKFGGVRKAFKWLIGDPDWKIETVSVAPDKGQFNETNVFLIAEVARWFGVPLHKIAELTHATFTNIEHQGIEAVQECIMPWATRFEQEANYKLFGNRPGFYTKINLRGLLRGDFKSQQEGLQIMRNGGAITADEWRSLVDMNKMPEGLGGDKFVIQGQYTTLDKVGEVAIPAAPEPQPGPSAAMRARIKAIGRSPSRSEYVS